METLDYTAYKQKFIEYLEANEIKYRDSGNKIQHVCISPEHMEDNPSAYTSFEDELEPYSYCSSCGHYLSTESLIDLLGGKVDKKALFRNKMNKMFKEFKAKKELEMVTKKEEFDWKNQVFLPPKHKDFRQEYRGISPNTYDIVNCFVTNKEHYYKKRLIFPLRDFKSTLLGFDAISTTKDIYPKVLRSKGTDTTKFFGFEDLLGKEELKDYFKQRDTVFICEGLFSALSFIELGYYGLFNFGVASIEDKLGVLYRYNIKTIVLCADKDSVGFKFNSEMYHLLKKSFKVKFFQHPFSAEEKSDSNDYLKKDKNLLEILIKKCLKII
jgi:hypothetical protein